MRTSLESLSSTALALAGILARCHAQSDDGPHDVPATEDFLRRLGSRACVIGDYIYFDGGELSERGFNVTGHLTNAANATLSIDLSTSWSPADVEINEIPRPSDNIPLNRQSILKQESEDTFYVWGGGASHGQTLQDPPVLWKFEADGRGGGSWSEESDLSNRGRFEQLDRTFGAAYASTPDKGFVFGGVSHKESAPSPVPSVAGHVAFDFDSKAWSREARAPYTSDGGLFGGTATYVPGFGPNGIILILGGVSGENEDEYPSFRRLHFMDPVTGQWFAQETSGDVPDERATHCSVGVQGHNGTYEIFVYGGEIRGSQATKRDVHALSLPGFRWTRAPDTGSTERRDHACAVVGGRHMLSWGGLNSTGGAHGHWSRQDPLPQGIGLFDMAAMRWVEQYDADAARYETHEDIMAWYETGGMRTVDWASDEVEALFAARESSEPVGGGGGSESGNGGGDGGSEDGGDDSVSTGTIVGAVVGGVGGLALIGGLAWFLLRRRRRGAATSTHAAPASAELSEAHAPPKVYGDHAYGDQTYGGHAYAGQQYAQAPSAPPVEAPGPVTSELTADSPPVEMADTSRARW